MPDLLLLDKLRDVVNDCIVKDVPLDQSTWWHPCGTFGCVAGWAAHYEPFISMGLRVVGGSYGNLGYYRAGNILYAGKSDIDALMLLFDLDYYQACYLFGNNPEITGQENTIDWYDALSRINEVMRGDI